MVKNKTTSIVCLVSLLLATFLLQIGTSMAVTYPTGLMYYYKMNNDSVLGATNITDFVNNREVTGTSIVGSQWVDAYNTSFNKSIDLDGTNDWFTTTHSVPTPLTLQAIIMVDTYGNYHTAFSNQNGAASKGVIMREDADLKIHCYMGTGATYVTAASNSQVTAGTWNFITCIYNSTGVYMYNGTTLQTTTGAGSLSVDATVFNIGKPPSENKWNGKIDEVRIWNISLNQQNITDFWSGELGVSEAAPDTTPPAISAVTNGTISNTSVVILWTTNEASNSSVKAGTSTTNMTIISSNLTSATSHRVNLTPLEMGKTYYYNVTSCDAAGNCNSTGIYNFTTPSAPTNAPIIRSSRISPTTAYFNTTLTGFCNATDSDTALIGYNFIWLKNNILILNTSNYKLIQETANTSLCSGSWEAAQPCINSFDGDWNTFASALVGGGIVEFNYTIPSNISLNDIKWHIKTASFSGTGILDLSINSTCLAYDNTTLHLRIISQSDATSQWYCQNSTTWVMIYETPPYRDFVYEEEIIWKQENFSNIQGIETNVSTLTGFTAGDNITFSCQATDGNLTSSWLNSTTVTILNYNATVPVISSPANRTVYYASSSVSIVYNSTNAESTPITYYVFINDVLNTTTTSGTTTKTYSDGIYNFSIIAWDGIANTTSTSKYWFAVDTSAPVISLISPINNTINNSANIIFTYSANDSILFLGIDGMNNCSIYLDGVLNQTNTTRVSGVGSFTINNIAEGSHTWSIGCYDDYGHSSQTGNYNLEIDTTNPIMSIVSPLNNSVVGFADNATFNFLASDTNFIYKIQANISHPSGLVLSSLNYTDDGSMAASSVRLNDTKKYNYYDNGTYTITYQVCDGHTAKDINGLIAEPKVADSEIDFKSFKLIPEDKANIVSASTKTEKDKISFDFNIKTVKTTKIDLTSKYKITYFPNSVYKGHFIIEETNQWIDFEGYENLKITKIDDYNYVVETTPTDKAIKGKSTGALNCISGKSYFSVSGTGVDVYAVINLTDLPISTYFATLYVGSSKIYKNTTTGKIEFNVSNGNYTVMVNVTGYGVQNLSVEVIGHTNVTASFFIANSVYFLFKDEETKLNLSNVTYEFIGNTYGNFSTTNGSIYSVLTAGEYIMRYTAEGYNTRTYYFTLDEGFNVVSSLYLLKSSSLYQNISVYVYDEGGDVVKEAYVKALKYDLTTNTYVQVDMCKTNQQGFCYLALQKFVEYYEFVVEYKGQTKVVTSPNYVIADTLQIRISLGSIAGADYDKIYGIYKTLDTVETGTPYFRYTYSDPLNVMSSACLYVYEETLTGRTLVNTSCLNTPSGTIVVYPVNTSNMTYRADAFGFINDKYIWFDTEFYSFETVLAINQYGIFIIIILTLIFIFIGLWSPSLMLVLTPIPLIMGKILGIVQINIVALVTMEFIAILIAFIISEKQVQSG